MKWQEETEEPKNRKWVNGKWQKFYCLGDYHLYHEDMLCSPGGFSETDNENKLFASFLKKLLEYEKTLLAVKAEIQQILAENKNGEKAE